MPNKIEDMTLGEILYDLQEEYENELLCIINSTAPTSYLKEVLEILYLIKQIRNID